MNEIDFFGHAFYAFMALGTYYLGKQDSAGWWLRMFGNAGWIVLGYQLGLWSIVLWEIVFLYLAWVAHEEWQSHEELVTNLEEKLDCLEDTVEQTNKATSSSIYPTTKFGLPYNPEDPEVVKMGLCLLWRAKLEARKRQK